MAEAGAPYVGPRPFEREDRGLFFGRDNEAAALASLIVAHQVVLLYAQSGAGKSSLLNADVAPRLQARGFEVFTGMRVSGDLPEGVDPASVRNIFVYNALSSLAQRRGSPASDTTSTIGDYLGTIPYPPAQAGGASIRVLVLDQFEELFTAFPERWKDRAAFFDQLGAALEGDPRLRVVLSMREEYIGGLDTFASRLPERLRTRFRLERLGADAALLAVTKPLETTERRFAPEAAAKLIDSLLKVPIKSATGVTDVSGEYVEPLHLQLVCTKLWNSLPASVKVIETQYIENLGDVDAALAAYYESCIAQVVKQTSTDEGTLRAWFERKLITSDGLRGLVPKGAQTSGGLPNDVVDRLQKLYLIRVEMRGANPWYELTHDRFVGPICRSNEHWRDTAGAGQVNTLEIEARAERWFRDGKPERQLLSGSDLAKANALLASQDARAFGVSEVASEYVRLSGLQSKRRWLRFGVAAILLLGIAASGWVFYLNSAKRSAEDATISARADVARKFATQRGLEFDALAYGMRAVAPRLDGAAPPPNDAMEGLRAALVAVGNDIRLRGRTGPIVPATAVALSPDGKRALAITKDSICAWNADTGKLARCLDLPKWVTRPDVQFSPDLRWIYRNGHAESSDAPRLWNAQLDEHRLEAELADTQNIAFSDDGNWAIARSADGRTKVVDLGAAKVSRSLNAAEGDVNGFAISPNGNSLVIVTRDNSVMVWDTRNGQSVAIPKNAGALDGYLNVTYAPDGQRIAVTNVKFDDKAQSQVWSIADGVPRKEGRPIEFAQPTGSLVKFSNDGSRLATLSANAASVWDVRDGKLLGKFEFTAGDYALLLDGARVLVGHSQANETRLAVYDIQTGQALKSRTVAGDLQEADVSNDLTRFLTVSKDGTVRLNPLDDDGQGPDERDPLKLFRIACAKIRNQPDFEGLDVEVKKRCNAGS